MARKKRRGRPPGSKNKKNDVSGVTKMDVAQLRDYITTHTGEAPIGAINAKTLRRMAREIQPEKASAA